MVPTSKFIQSNGWAYWWSCLASRGGVCSSSWAWCPIHPATAMMSGSGHVCLHWEDGKVWRRLWGLMPSRPICYVWGLEGNSSSLLISPTLWPYHAGMAYILDDTFPISDNQTSCMYASNDERERLTILPHKWLRPDSQPGERQGGLSGRTASARQSSNSSSEPTIPISDMGN